MKRNVPPPSRAIRIVTICYFILTLGFAIAGYFRHELLVGAAILLLVALGCYFFWAPVAYELSDNALTVYFRASRKRFGPVVRCTAGPEKPGFGVRLWGNGGLFAGSGIFWSRRYGVFRAYVTRSKHTEWVLVETMRWKIIISPEDPQEFVKVHGMTSQQL